MIGGNDGRAEERKHTSKATSKAYIYTLTFRCVHDNISARIGYRILIEDLTQNDTERD